MDEMNTDFWVTHVLETLEHGEALETALEQVPEPLRAEVQDAVEAALWLSETARPTLQAAAAQWEPPTLSQENLPARRTSRLPRLRAAATGWLAAMRVGLKPAIGLALLLLFLVTWQTARAASRALPGEWAYPLKQVGEHIRFALTGDPVDRLVLTVTFADRRLEEAVMAQQRHLVAAEDEGLARYAQMMQQALKQWESLPPGQQVALRPFVAAKLRKQNLLMTSLDRMLAGKAWQQALSAQQAFWRTVGEAPPGPMLSRGTPVPSSLAPTATATATLTATATATPSGTETCVSRGLGQAQNTCVPPDQGKGNDVHDNPADSGANPPGKGTPPTPPAGGNHGKP